jgi:geranylgeranyl diphosphate synthase type I
MTPAPHRVVPRPAAALPEAHDLRGVRRAVDAVLERFLDAKERGPYGAHLTDPLEILRDFLGAGGKRVRPLYLCTGWYAVRGAPLTAGVLKAAAGVELFHTFALLHDDVIDRSEVRHHRPTAQLQFGAIGSRRREPWFGESAAVLLGDLCEAWSAELLGDASAIGPARVALDAMRSELVVGQYLDLCASGEGFGSVAKAMQVIHFKTTKYTVERPMQLGAALAGADSAALEACSAYARPLGEAFQLLDDLEDVLELADGGTESGTDVREGKHTVVLALAAARCDRASAARLRRLVGDRGLDAEQLAEARAIIAATGAIRDVKEMILDRRRQAMNILDHAPFHSDAKSILARLTDLAVPQVASWDGA